MPDPGHWGSLLSEGVLGMRDLPTEVVRIGLRPGDPVFVAPDGTVDRGLLDFVRSVEFRDLERETKRNYATDIRPLLTFLSLTRSSVEAGDEAGLGGLPALEMPGSTEPAPDQRDEVEPGGRCVHHAVPVGEGVPAAGGHRAARGPGG